MDAPKINKGFLSADELEQFNSENEQDISSSQNSQAQNEKLQEIPEVTQAKQELVDNVQQTEEVNNDVQSDQSTLSETNGDLYQENAGSDKENSEPDNGESTTSDNEDSDINSQNLEDVEKVVDFSEENEHAQKVAKKKARKPKKKFSVIKFLLKLVLIFVVILSVYGIWNRWFRYDDTTDLVSQWLVHGTNTAVTIDKKQIVLDKDTTFKYEIDTGAKVVYLSTGNYTGACHYRFSWDRCQIAFIDSCDMNPVSTAICDLCWFSDYITCRMNGIGLSPAYTKESGQDVDTSNTGIEEIINNGHTETVLLDKVSTQKADSEKTDVAVQ